MSQFPICESIIADSARRHNQPIFSSATSSASDFEDSYSYFRKPLKLGLAFGLLQVLAIYNLRNFRKYTVGQSLLYAALKLLSLALA